MEKLNVQAFYFAIDCAHFKTTLKDIREQSASYCELVDNLDILSIFHMPYCGGFRLHITDYEAGEVQGQFRFVVHEADLDNAVHRVATAISHFITYEGTGAKLEQFNLVAARILPNLDKERSIHVSN